MMGSPIRLIACSLLLVASVSAQCSLCPGGSSAITDPDAIMVTGSVLDESCREIEEKVSAVSNSACGAMLASTNEDVNYSAFCCSNVQPSNSCDFCSGVNIDELQRIPSDLSPFLRTCGETADFAVYITGRESCLQLNNGVGREICCNPPPSGQPTDNPTNRPTTKAPIQTPTGNTPTAPTTAPIQTPTTNAPVSLSPINTPVDAPTPAPGIASRSSASQFSLLPVVVILGLCTIGFVPL
eukprot:scaffold444_cov109-Cylindrotheca_fusiformis.AAC.15